MAEKWAIRMRQARLDHASSHHFDDRIDFKREQPGLYMTEQSAVQPRVGNSSSERRILIVGESAYSTDGWRWSPTSNTDLISDQIDRDPERAIKDIARVIAKQQAPEPSYFWHGVSFANLVCCDIGIGRMPAATHSFCNFEAALW
jgi:hypothetical protein